LLIDRDGPFSFHSLLHIDELGERGERKFDFTTLTRQCFDVDVQRIWTFVF